MAEQTTISAGGLATSPNELAVPAGALVKAQNCVVLAPGIIGSRRGQESVGYALAANGNAGFIYDDTLIVHSGTTTLSRDTGAAFTAYSGSYTPPDATLLRMKALAANENLYFTTNAGVYRLDGVERTPALAGGPVPFDLSSAGLLVVVGGGFLQTSSSVAYRVVWGTVDAHDTLILGPPSGRWVVVNESTTDTYNTSITFPVPSTATTSMFWRLYRSAQFPSSGTPGDELSLVYEAFFTSDQITAGEVAYNDTTPDAFLGVPLYTNASEDGATQPNDPPPLAKDITSWNQRAWYANTRGLQTVNIQLLGCGPGTSENTGLRLNDSLIVGGFTFIAGASEFDAGLGRAYFTLQTSGTPTENIEATARSLVNMINTVSGSLYRATYESGVGDPPGKIRITNKTPAATGAGGFTTTFALRALPYVNAIGVGDMVRAANVVTVTTADPHGLEDGDYVGIRPVSPSLSDANFPQAEVGPVTRTGASTFTVPWTGANAANTLLCYVARSSPAEQLAWSPPPPPGYFTVAAGGLVRTGGTTVTVTTTGSVSGLFPGALVVLEPTNGTADAAFPAGTKTVATVVSSTSFTYTEAGSNTSSTVAYQSGARVISDPFGGIAGPEFVSYSKIQQPEAVPALNNFPVGTAGDPILRIAPLGDNLFVFKNEGIFIVSGEAPFRVDLLDDTVKLYAPDSVVAVSGRLYALTNQGVVAVTNNGAQIVSGPIEQELFTYFGPTLANVRVNSFGVSRETDRLYELHLPALSGATTAPYNARRAYVFSTLANAWTTWELARNWGAVRLSDDAYFSGGTTTAVYQERNTKTAEDYADAETTVTPDETVTDSYTLLVTSASGVTAGDVLEDDDGDLLVVTNVSGNTLTLSGLASATGETGATATVDFSVYDQSELLVGATINLTPVLVTGDESPPADVAAAFAAAVIAAFPGEIDATANLDGTVDLEAIGSFAGTAGNAITLTTDVGYGVIVSGPTFTGGVDAVPLSLFKAIPNLVKFRAHTANAPGDQKQYGEIHLHFRQRSFRKGTLSLTTDLVTSAQEINYYPAQTPQLASPPDYTADTTLYPGLPVEPTQGRIALTSNSARGSYLNVAWSMREAFAVWWLNGHTLVYERISPKGMR